MVSTTAKWEHVVALYEADHLRSMRAAPKLKKAHVSTPRLKKMKVNLATRAMSRSVAAAMHLYASFGNSERACCTKNIGNGVGGIGDSHRHKG